VAEADTAARTNTVSTLLVLTGILAQIGYPLLSGEALEVATVLSVLLLSAGGVLHAAAAWGPGAAGLLLALAGGLGLLAETIGVHTGFPFGVYHYAGGLGPRLAGVPLVVPLAWTMLAYPCLLLGRRLAHKHRRGRWATALTGGIALAAWDLFLDPQMVAQGNWTWADSTPALPGVPGVPLTDYAGWLLISVLMTAALDRCLPIPFPPRKLAPAAVLAWTWLGSAVGNLMFFDRPWVALYGGLAMGTVTLPYLLIESGRHR